MAFQDDFWIIWSPQSDKPPRKRFYTQEEAERVARIMAKQYTPQEFYVLEAKYCVQLSAFLERRYGSPYKDRY